MNLETFFIRPSAPAMLHCLLCLAVIGVTAVPSAQAQTMVFTAAGTSTTDTVNTADSKEGTAKESRAGYYAAAAVGLGLGLSQWNASRTSHSRSFPGNRESVVSPSFSAVHGRLHEPPQGPEGNVFVPSKQGSVTVTSPQSSLSRSTAGSSDTGNAVSSYVSRRSDDSGFSTKGGTIVSDVSLGGGTGAALALSPLRLLQPDVEDRDEGPIASAGRATGSTVRTAGSVGAAATTAVPEPGEWATMGMAGMSVGCLMLRTRRRRISKPAA